MGWRGRGMHNRSCLLAQQRRQDMQRPLRPEWFDADRDHPIADFRSLQPFRRFEKMLKRRDRVRACRLLLRCRVSSALLAVS